MINNLEKNIRFKSQYLKVKGHFIQGRPMI